MKVERTQRDEGLGSMLVKRDHGGGICGGVESWGRLFHTTCPIRLPNMA